MNVVVLGASGMLGSMVVDWLCRDRSLRVMATVRSPAISKRLQSCYPNADWGILDIGNLLPQDPVADDLQRAYANPNGLNPDDLIQLLHGAEWVVNCIGLIKPHIHEAIPAEIERAIRVNAMFPYALARAAEACKSRVLQIATDCVYSGTKGEYLESDTHDAWDVYGKTKSLGEVRSPNVHHLRVSIIGPEPIHHVSLLDWFLQQPCGSSVTGYVNHRWNGITTLQFARLCHAVIRENLDLNLLQHVVPSGSVTKAELMHYFAEVFHRKDVSIHPAEANPAADRTLGTVDPSANRRLWAAAGYSTPPSVSQMLSELAEFDSNYGLEAGARAGG